MLQKIQETAEYLRGKMTTAPETAIILGTGLGSLVNEITDKPDTPPPIEISESSELTITSALESKRFPNIIVMVELLN